MATSHRRSERPSRAGATPSSPALIRPAEAVTLGARRVTALLAEPGTRRGRDEWLAVAGDCQSLINTLTAVQDAAIAEVARRENVWCEDGSLGETVHGPGRVSLDAADVVAPVIGASHAQAQSRVEQAVRLATGRNPLEADDRDVPETSGLHGLHEAMAAGHLDGFRAGVIAFELDVAPADVADAIVTALSTHLGDDASTLRRRARVMLSRISPDLVRERAKRARAATGLRRWVGEPGVDEWHGTFPSEDAAVAWAAIDRLAHDLVAAGTCSNVEQARGKALTDLVTGNATVDVQVVLTVPADTGSPHAAASSTNAGPDPAPWNTTGSRQPAHHDDDLLEVQGARPSEPLLVRRDWLRDHLPTAPPRPRRGAKRVQPPFVPCDPLTGARLDADDHLATDAYRPGEQLAALVRTRDGRCRFPGCSVAARFCDLDHVRPWPTGPTAASNLLTLCRRHHRIKQRPGWRIHLTPDATATWTDPTGRERTTAPLDALRSLVLMSDPAEDEGAAVGATTAAATEPVAEDRAQARAPVPVGSGASGWSALETHLEIRFEHPPGLDPDRGGRDPWHHRTHRRCTSALDLREASAARARAAVPDVPPF